MRDYIYSFNSVGLPSVIGIVETWLHKDISNDCFNLPEYNITRFDRPTKGGGDMLLSNVKYQIAKSECFFFGPIQVLFCDILSLLTGFEMYRIVCVYRPTNYEKFRSLSFLNALESAIAPLKSAFPIIVVGDFNLTKINWPTLSPTLNHTNSDSQLIISSQRSHLLQKVLSPTHHINITDLLFISIDNILTNVVVDMPFTTSDHNTIHFELLTPNHSSFSSAHSSDINTIPKLDFAKTDHAGLSECLLSTDWHHLFSPSDPIDVAWESFSRYICSLIVRFTPLKKQFTHNKSNSIPPQHQAFNQIKTRCMANLQKTQMPS